MQTSKRRNVETSKPSELTISVSSTPVARGPLLNVHHGAGATIEIVNGWEVAVRYPEEARRDGNALIDLSHWPTYEVNGPDTTAILKSISADVPLRTIQTQNDTSIYRLTDRRAILFQRAAGLSSRGADWNENAIDVTGGWASIALCGPDALNILNKVTAIDLRLTTLPINGCCQGPIFGVNTLFGRFENRFELHICTDSTEFFWEVLLDAGSEFDLKPAGLDAYKRIGID